MDRLLFKGGSQLTIDRFPLFYHPSIVFSSVAAKKQQFWVNRPKVDFFVSMAQVMFTDGRFLERLHA